jgi:hypothetical protein
MLPFCLTLALVLGSSFPLHSAEVEMPEELKKFLEEAKKKGGLKKDLDKTLEESKRLMEEMKKAEEKHAKEKQKKEKQEKEAPKVTKTDKILEDMKMKHGTPFLVRSMANKQFMAADPSGPMQTVDEPQLTAQAIFMLVKEGGSKAKNIHFGDVVGIRTQHKRWVGVSPVEDTGKIYRYVDVAQVWTTQNSMTLAGVDTAPILGTDITKSQATSGDLTATVIARNKVDTSIPLNKPASSAVISTQTSVTTSGSDPTATAIANNKVDTSTSLSKPGSSTVISTQTSATVTGSSATINPVPGAIPDPSTPSNISRLNSNLTVWRPVLPDSSWLYLSDIGTKDSDPQPEYGVVFKDNTVDFQSPAVVEWIRMWKSTGLPVQSPGFFWTPICPPNYYYIGAILSGTTANPIDPAYKCISTDYLDSLDTKNLEDYRQSLWSFSGPPYPGTTAINFTKAQNAPLAWDFQFPSLMFDRGNSVYRGKPWFESFLNNKFSSEWALEAEPNQVRVRKGWNPQTDEWTVYNAYRLKDRGPVMDSSTILLKDKQGNYLRVDAKKGKNLNPSDLPRLWSDKKKPGQDARFILLKMRPKS